MKDKKCATCGNLLTGRTDKKYCSDQCRYIQNNKNKQDAEQPLLEINRQLRKNRSILKVLCPVGKATVRKEVMLAMGYDVTLFSSLFLTAKKQVYYLCYDYGFTPLNENGAEKALIVTKQEYMRVWDPWKFVNKSQ
jgi:predicted nucleic acid-binding Zn ribbon protein